MPSYGMMFLRCYWLIFIFGMEVVFAGASPPQQTESGAVRPSVQRIRAPKKNLVLDTAKIHSTYMEGDFEPAIKALEKHLKSARVVSHQDSVFIFKHLGVMYAADPGTREKGRYFMYQLINIEPTAKILDMYASDVIFLIYRNVQEDYERQHSQVPAMIASVDTSKVEDSIPAVPDSIPVAIRPANPSHSVYWIAGGVAFVAGTAGLAYVLFSDPKPKTQSIIISE